MSWLIVADSSCELKGAFPCKSEAQFAIAPLKIRFGEKEYVDDDQLDLEEMLQTMRSYDGASTSACPSPEEWAAQFEKADQVLAVAMTSALSGTYNSAMVARDLVLEAHPEKKIHVFDTLSTAGQMVLLIRHLDELIAQGCSFEDIVQKGEAFNKKIHLLFALASFENLVKNGRMNRVVGMIASKLNIRAIGIASEKGKIELLHKARGEMRTLEKIVEEMRKLGLSPSRTVEISQCQNEQGAQLLKSMILANFPDVTVNIRPCCGLTSYYAEEAGMIVGF